MNPDPMDELLSQLPSEPCPPGLGRQVRLAFRQQNLPHRRRESLARLGLGAALGLTGVWLVLPALSAWYMSLPLPASSVSLSFSMLELAWQGIVDLIMEAGGMLLGMQAGFSQALDLAALLGLVALAASVLLALGALMPQDREVSG